MTDRELADMIVASAGYRLFAGPTDKAKVTAASGGVRKPSPSNREARVAWELYLREPPAAPLPSIHDLGRNVMFTAQNPEAALRCPPQWRIALSADPRYDMAVRAAAPKIREKGHLIAVWGVQTQVGATRIKQLGEELGADFLIFQAETPDEYDTAIGAGAKLIVGNPNNWTDGQRDDAIARGDTLTTLFEVYSNEGSPFPDTASSRNVPVSCEVLGVGWGANPYQLNEYRPRTPDGVWATISVYAAEYMDDESWGLLP